MDDSARNHSPPTGSPLPAYLKLHESAGELELELGGDWRNAARTPDGREIERRFAADAKPRVVKFSTAGVTSWDSRLLTFVLQTKELCAQHGSTFATETLPGSLRKLIALAEAVPETKDARRQVRKVGLVARFGEGGLTLWNAGKDILTFLGQCALAFLQLLRGKARFRWSDALVVMQETGAEALPIVMLINLLVGLILGFVGTVQLAGFGAVIYVADLVGIAMVREMGCMMTGIIMSGRTGAAFAAQLGTMKVNEEIDAFRVLGISPIEFLVLPRMVALFLMMPLLCGFADLMGILGGLLVTVAMHGLSVREYWHETVAAISMTNFVLGIVKGSFFGLLIAVTGCLRGVQCGSTAAAVGRAATSAVVLGITSIIVADAVFAVLCNVLGI